MLPLSSVFLWSLCTPPSISTSDGGVQVNVPDGRFQVKTSDAIVDLTDAITSGNAPFPLAVLFFVFALTHIIGPPTATRKQIKSSMLCPVVLRDAKQI